MAKQGMSRPERTHTQPHNDAPPVPELQGKAKHTKKKANPIVAGTSGPTMLVYHERPIPVDAYPELDTDLARDNLENDLPAADREDLIVLSRPFHGAAFCGPFRTTQPLRS